MQPIYKSPMPPQGPGMRPMGGPSFGSLPPPQRPPAGYRPQFTSGGSQSQMPPSGMMGPPGARPPFNPPVQKMAAMNLDAPTSQQNRTQFQLDTGPSFTSEPSQFLSNGVPDQNASSPSSANGAQCPPFSQAQRRDSYVKGDGDHGPSSFDSVQPHSESSRTQGESFPHSHSPSLNQSSQPTTPDVNSSRLPSFPPNANMTSPSSSLSSGPPGYGLNTTAPSNVAPLNSAFSSSSSIHTPKPPSAVPSNSPHMMPSHPGMTPSAPKLQSNSPRPSMPPMGMPGASPSSHMGSSMPPHSMPSSSLSPGMPPTSSHHGPLPPGMPPSSSYMASSVPPTNMQMGFSPGMPPNSQMGSRGPGMPPTSSQMGPHAPGMPPMPPTSSQMGPSFPGMRMPPPGMPPSNQMGSPRPGVPPSAPYMGSGSTGMMPPTSSPLSPQPGISSAPGMPPPPTCSSYMSAGGPGMPPPPTCSSYMSAGGPGMPPPPTCSSYMSAGGPGMPPPPTCSSYMSAGGPGMPPPPVGSHMGPPGVPPMPNQGAAPGIGGMQNRYPGSSPGGAPGPGFAQGGQGRRLNLDDMPSPLQVMEDDRRAKTGEFLTNLKGGLPPLVTTDFVVKDGGNASPRFLRSTMYNIPATQDIMKQASIPFGLVISPLADLHQNEAPLYPGTILPNGPVRCNRCKGYMSPLMVFMDGGRRFQCLLCKQINEVPADYYSHMDSQGSRADKYQKPELCLGSYEFVATAEYCKDKKLPNEPAFIFVLEMSQMMVQRGIISLLCQNMKSLLKHLPKDEVPGQEAAMSSIRVGFITYDSSVHFYKLTGLAPEMCIVCDRENMFVPVPDGVLCSVEEVTENIDKLMESIPQNFQTTRETSGALSCAIQAGMAALKASGRVGKLFVFHSSLPHFEGLGKLKNREDRKLLGTDKEKSILSPQNTHYNNLAQDLVNVGCGVDLYVFNESYVDLATIGQVARLTGGQCFKYTFFQPNKDSERLLNDLRINIGRNIVFDSVMRVRTSTGVRPVEFFGHFFMSNTQDIELAILDSSKGIAVEIKHDDKITEEDGVYIQVALLYTSVGGQRRLRIMNLALNICTQMADLFKDCDLDTLMNFFAKQSMFKFLENSAKQVKDNLISRTAQILACYRKNCASPSSAGQLILPELMKLLPLYINCLAKCDALSGGQDLTCDDRSWHIFQLTTMTVEASVAYLYPRLIPLFENVPEDETIPSAIRTSYEKLSPDEVYILENGLFMFMWVGSGTPSTWMKDVFGVSAPHQLDPVLSELPEFENTTSEKVRGIIEAIRQQRKLHVRLFVVPQQGKHEVVMRNYLVEDKGVFGAPSYVDFLCHVHKEIRALLS